jgi:hypothetical protein
VGDLGRLVQSCDLHALLLGGDFSAPIGFEVRSALASGRCTLGAYRKECTRSPSAQDAVRTLEVRWQPYSTLSAFRSLFKRDLLRALLDEGSALGLDMTDVERLVQERQAAGAISDDTAERRLEASGPRGAGNSGRILGREVWQTGEPD